jgi:hypothetical protein
MVEAFLIGLLSLDLGILFASVEQMVKSSNSEAVTSDDLTPGKDDWDTNCSVRGGGVSLP